MGFSVAQVIWRPNADNSVWMPDIEPWHPAFIYVDTASHTYFALTTEGPVQVTPGTGQWILYAPHGHRYAWMTGAIRSIATPWLARAYTWRDWLRANELYSLGIRKAKVPENASEQTKKAFFQQIAALGSNSTILVPQGVDGERASFDIDVLFPPNGNGATGFETLMSKAESKIAIRINGQNLTTEAKGGSFAAAKVHENVMEGILDADSNSLGQCLTKQVVEPYIDFHPYPPNTRPPVIAWNTAPPEDIDKRADSMLKVGQALAAFGSARAPADPRAVLIKFDIPALPPDAPIPPPPAAPAPGVPVVPKAPGDGAGHPFGAH
jgi:phage gp29-like protein